MVSYSNPDFVVWSMVNDFTSRFPLRLRRHTTLAIGLGLFLVLAPHLVAAQTAMNLEMHGAATSSGSTTAVAEDDTIDWHISYTNISGGVLHDVIISNVLNGNQNFVTGSAQTPPGWLFDEPTQTFRAPVVCSNNTATCAGSRVQPMGLYIGTAGTGGDGWAPVIHPSNGRIYNTYHHTDPGIIQCVDTVQGARCDGYPIVLQSGSPTDSFPQETNTAGDLPQIQFVGNRYYYPVFRFSSFNEPEWGLGCFDVHEASPGPCDGQGGRSLVGVNGFVRMGPQNPGVSLSDGEFYSVIEGPWIIGDRLYMVDFYEMRLHCYNPDTNQLCGTPYPVALSHTNFPAATESNGRNHPIAGEVLDTRLLIVMNYANVDNVSSDEMRVRCWDTQSESFCWGSTVPTIAPGEDTKRMNAFLRFNTSGNPDAICSAVSVGSSDFDGAGCADLNGNPIASGTNHTRGVPTILLERLEEAGGDATTQEVSVNGRSYFPSENGGNGVVCWNWLAGALCSGFGSSGLLTYAQKTSDYGVAYDKRTGCLWSLGHTNVLWNFDASGNVPCEPSVVNLQATVTPSTFFCATGVGNVAWSWSNFQADDMSMSDWQSLEVDIIGADGTTVLQTFNLKDLGTATVDLSGIANIGSQAALSFELRGIIQPGVDLFSGGRQPQAFLNFDSDTPGELCFQSQPYNGSCSGSSTAMSTSEIRLQDGTVDDTASTTFTILPTGFEPAPLVTMAAVTTNERHVLNTARIYQSRFDTGSWSGHLYSHPLDNDGTLQPPEWDAATVLDGQEWSAGRAILTLDPSTGQGIPFQWASLDVNQQNRLHANAQGMPDAQGESRLQYLRGSSIFEGPGLPFRVRQHRLGAVVHAAPQYVGAPPFSDDVGTHYSNFRSTYESRMAMVYVGSSDGMLHGFDATTGTERLAYVPHALFAHLSALTDPNWTYRPMVDGPLTILDAYGDFQNSRCGSGNTCWRSVLVGSLGEGGQGIYALDVTDPGSFSETNAAKLLLWEFTDAHDVDLGDTWSQPSIVRMSNNRWAAVLGNGYHNTAPDGRRSTTGNAVLYIVFLDAGLDGAWTIGSDVIKLDTGVGALPPATPNGLAAPALVDVDGDLTTDFIYAGDRFGNVWKFDVRLPNPNQWVIANGGPLFVATDSGGQSQPITTRPEAGLNPYDPDGFLIYIGTGQYLSPEDALATGTTQSIYALWDTPDNASTPIAASDLIQQEVLQVMGDQRITSDHAIDWTHHRGWYLEFPTAGERVVTRPILRNERLIVTTFIPTGELCHASGTGWLMELDAITGNRLPFPPFDRNGDGHVDAADLIDATLNGEKQQVASSGILSTEGVLAMPVILQKGNTERKFSNGSSGTIMATTENPGHQSRGRQAWRSLP